MSHPLVRPAGRWMRDVLTDEEVVRRVLAGEVELFELIVRRYNQPLFRTVRAIVRNDADAEDALQQAYVNAWLHLAAYDGRARFGTWLTRIAIRAAGEQARRRDRCGAATAHTDGARLSEPAGEGAPDRDAARRELAAMLELSIDALPEPYRVVFVLRVLEDVPTAEVAANLGLTESAVKVRLHRARAELRRGLLERAIEAGALAETWPIGGERCDRIVAEVLPRIGSNGL